MFSWIIIPISAIANRWRGGGICKCPDGLRKPIYCIVTGAVFGLLAWDIWAGLIVAIGSLPVTITSPRPMFNAWRGADGVENTTVNILNGWMHRIAEFVTNKVRGAK